MKNEKLYRARIDRHWSQEKAAEKIGVVRKTYIEWENGLRRPHISLLADIQKAFNMTPQQLGLYENEARPQHATTTSFVQVPSMQLVASSQTAAVTDMFSAGIKALMAAQQQNAWTIEELRFRTEQEMTRLDAMARRQDSKKISRRYTLGFLIELPLALSGATAPGGRTPLPLAQEEVLPLYVTSIPACWRLFFDSEVEVVENVLPVYISHLTAFAQQPSRYQRAAASLLSQTHQLGSRVSLEHEDFGSSLRAYPNNPVARKAIKPQAKWRNAR